MKATKAGLAGIILLIITIIILWSAFIAFLFMVAWNFVMPELFNLPTLGFIQAWAFMFVIHMVLSGARAVIRDK